MRRHVTGADAHGSSLACVACVMCVCVCVCVLGGHSRASTQGRCRVALTTLLRNPAKRMESAIFFMKTRRADVRDFVANTSNLQVKYIMFGSPSNWPWPYVVGGGG